MSNSIAPNSLFFIKPPTPNRKMKHTPTPWVFNDLEMKIKGSGDIEGRTVIANVSTKMDYSRGHNTQCANAARIVECVNAMEGIENPEEFMKAVLQNGAKGFWYNQVKSQRLELTTEIGKLREEIKELKAALSQPVEPTNTK